MRPLNALEFKWRLCFFKCSLLSTCLETPPYFQPSWQIAKKEPTFAWGWEWRKVCQRCFFAVESGRFANSTSGSSEHPRKPNKAYIEKVTKILKEPQEKHKLHERAQNPVNHGDFKKIQLDSSFLQVNQVIRSYNEIMQKTKVKFQFYSTLRLTWPTFRKVS